MKRLAIMFTVCALSSLASLSALAATPQEKDFLDSYRKALEANDTKTLEGFLYAKDADPEALEYFKESLPLDEGFTVAQLELVAVTPDEVQKALKPMPGRDGKLSALPVKPTGKLIIKVQSQGDDNATLTTQRAVAEIDGKLRILVPAVVKR